MSLSARVALDRSRVVARLERWMPAAGLAIAAAFATARWPDAAWPLGIGAVVAGLVVAAVAPRRRARGLAIAVSDCDEIGLVGRDAGLPPDGWRLAEPTLHWPSFAIVALRHDDARRTLCVPVALGALPPADRWALARFLGWALRRARSADERRVT